jgi:aminoglycoside phosphotransferase (APT) family kinase protein
VTDIQPDTADADGTPPDPELIALARWLEPRLEDASQLRLDSNGKPGSGFSAETTILAATWLANGVQRTGKFVLRRETPDPPVYPTQIAGLETEVDIQYRVMSAIAASSTVPLAPLHGYEADPAVLGAPFFVMGFVDGEVPVESPMYTLEGFFTQIPAEQRRSMIDDGVATLAAIHAIDWQAAGLGWLTEGHEPTVRRQLDLWSAYSERELAGREHPPLARAWAWLQATCPEPGQPALAWGDPRPGNIIWRAGRAACVTDFEAASIAPPEIDLGWWLMFDRWSHESSGAPRLEGEPTRAEQVTLYEQLSGRAVGDTLWYEVFAAARYAAIVVRVMNRLVDRGHMPVDHRIWIENPVVPCLVELLAEARA